MNLKMGPKDRYNYNKLASNPVLATIDSLKKLKELGKIYTVEIVEKEIKGSSLYKDNEIKKEDIDLIINELYKSNFFSEE